MMDEFTEGGQGPDLEWMDLAEEAGQLREAMSTRAPIEQAKGILMTLRGFDSETAWAELKRAYPFFADHEEKAGEREIPVVALVRA